MPASATQGGHNYRQTWGSCRKTTLQLFKTNNLDVVKTCQQYFNFEMRSTLWTKRSASFENKFSSSENVFYKTRNVSQCPTSWPPCRI